MHQLAHLLDLWVDGAFVAELRRAAGAAHQPDREAVVHRELALQTGFRLNDSHDVEHAGMHLEHDRLQLGWIDAVGTEVLAGVDHRVADDSAAVRLERIVLHQPARAQVLHRRPVDLGSHQGGHPAPAGKWFDRTGEPLLGQQCRLHASRCRATHLEGLGHRAELLGVSGRLSCGDRDRRRGALGIEREDPRGGAGRPDRTGGGGDVPAAVEVRRPQAVAEAAGHLDAGDHAGHQRRAVRTGEVGGRQRCGHDRGTGMQDARQIGVVEVLDVRGQPVDQRRPRCGEQLGAAQHLGGPALAEVVGRGHDRVGGRGMRGAHRQPDDVGGGAASGHPRWLRHVLPLQSCDERADPGGDVGAHAGVSFFSAASSARAVNQPRALGAEATDRAASTTSFSRPGSVRSTRAMTLRSSWSSDNGTSRLPRACSTAWHSVAAVSQRRCQVGR